MSDAGPVRPKTMNMADAQVWTGQFSLVQRRKPSAGAPTQVASATFRDRSPTINVDEAPAGEVRTRPDC